MGMREIEKIALFDFDGVLADYDLAMARDYEKIKSPGDLPYCSFKRDEEPPYVKERIKLIRCNPGWWRNLPEYKPGFDILKIAIDLGFQIRTSTKGPLSAINSLTEKGEWFKEHIKSLAPESKLTITEDKGGIYGTVLVEDYWENIEKWLVWRERGLVVMPAHPWNEEHSHPSVIRYDGTNIDQVRERMLWAKNRTHNI